MNVYLTKCGPERAQNIVAVRDVLRMIGADAKVSIARALCEDCENGKAAYIGVIELDNVLDNARTRLGEAECGLTVATGDEIPLSEHVFSAAADKPVAPEVSPDSRPFKPGWQTSQAAMILLAISDGHSGKARHAAALLGNVHDKEFWEDVQGSIVQTFPTPKEIPFVILQGGAEDVS